VSEEPPLLELPKVLTESVTEALAELFGGTEEARKLAAALTADIARLLPPPLNTIFSSPANNILSSVDPILAESLSILNTAITILTTALKMIPWATLLLLAGITK
jgi:hypothetical protein